MNILTEEELKERNRLLVLENDELLAHDSCKRLALEAIGMLVTGKLKEGSKDSYLFSILGTIKHALEDYKP